MTLDRRFVAILVLGLTAWWWAPYLASLVDWGKLADDLGFGVSRR